MNFKLFLAISTSLALTTQAIAAEPIKIGVPIGLSGALSVVSPSAIQSAELAVDQINATGGVLGRPLKLEIADDASSAAGAQKAFDTLIFKKEVDAIITMETSASRNAGLPIVSKGNIPFIYTLLYEGGSCNPNLFVNAEVPSQQIPPMVDYLMKNNKGKKFFLVGSDYSFGRGMLDFTKSYIKKQGASVVGEEYLPIDGSDWTAIISKLKSSGADAIITSTVGGSGAITFIKQLHDAGVKLPYGNLSLDEGTAKSIGSDAQDIIVSGAYLSNIDLPENKKFLAAMSKKFGDKLINPNDLSVPQYDGIYLYKAAVEKAGTTDSKAVLKALAQVSFNGPRGTVSMNKQHHAPLSIYLGQVQADGSVKVIQTLPNVDPGEQCPKL